MGDLRQSLARRHGARGWNGCFRARLRGWHGFHLGTVIDSDEQPVTEGCVRAYDLADTSVSFSWIGPDGSCRLKDLDYGRLQGRVRALQRERAVGSTTTTPELPVSLHSVSVTDGVDTSGINARLDVVGRSRVSGPSSRVSRPGICVYADQTERHRLLIGIRPRFRRPLPGSRV